MSIFCEKHKNVPANLCPVCNPDKKNHLENTAGISSVVKPKEKYKNIIEAKFTYPLASTKNEGSTHVTVTDLPEAISYERTKVIGYQTNEQEPKIKLFREEDITDGTIEFLISSQQSGDSDTPIRVQLELVLKDCRVYKGGFVIFFTANSYHSKQNSNTTKQEVINGETTASTSNESSKHRAGGFPNTKEGDTFTLKLSPEPWVELSEPKDSPPQTNDIQETNVIIVENNTQYNFKLISSVNNNQLNIGSAKNSHLNVLQSCKSETCQGLAMIELKKIAPQALIFHRNHNNITVSCDKSLNMTSYIENDKQISKLHNWEQSKLENDIEHTIAINLGVNFAVLVNKGYLYLRHKHSTADGSYYINENVGLLWLSGSFKHDSLGVTFKLEKNVFWVTDSNNNTIQLEQNSKNILELKNQELKN